MKWREGFHGEWKEYTPPDRSEPETHPSYAEVPDWIAFAIIVGGLALLIWGGWELINHWRGM